MVVTERPESALIRRWRSKRPMHGVHPIAAVGSGGSRLDSRPWNLRRASLRKLHYAVV